jgi:ubiquinone biosynthesis protein Coq4
MMNKVTRIVTGLRGWHAGLTLLRDPSRLDMVIRMERALPPESREALLARVRRVPEGRAAIAARARLGAVDVERLLSLPEGTLGRAFATFLRENGLDPRALPTLPGEDDRDYVEAHLYETHDIWHVATGFGPDIAGELGLQAFYAAQLGGKLPPLLLAGGLFHAAVKQPEDFDRRMAALARGWDLGRRARPLFGVRWNERWAEPLVEVRRDLGLAEA